MVSIKTFLQPSVHLVIPSSQTTGMIRHTILLDKSIWFCFPAILFLCRLYIHMSIETHSRLVCIISNLCKNNWWQWEFYTWGILQEIFWKINYYHKSEKGLFLQLHKHIVQKATPQDFSICWKCFIKHSFSFLFFQDLKYLGFGELFIYSFFF